MCAEKPQTDFRFYGNPASSLWYLGSDNISPLATKANKGMKPTLPWCQTRSLSSYTRCKHPEPRFASRDPTTMSILIEGVRPPHLSVECALVVHVPRCDHHDPMTPGGKGLREGAHDITQAPGFAEGRHLHVCKPMAPSAWGFRLRIYGKG
ncbi:hypothetical protein DUNSADRAFT_7143 [Dunaliella salina]|uniref:Encoded protein n=1 Tax=Dunaliella salina TaxID=3046 RepID=A0ABQ7FUI2_DUNSA|nr:hypothetical protein DUNSADRAFT_7143 [Dunaliella salina]|eukprot:KAF5825761.1 hypothetical protein DUNSADRAFT_7143 [Dunaliella salina]